MPEVGTAFESVYEQPTGGMPAMGMREVNSIEQRRKLAKEIQDYHGYYTSQLERPFRRAVRHQRLFLNAIKDQRRADEQWRAFVPMPYLFSAVKSLTAAFNDLEFSINPPVQPGAVGGMDDVKQEKFTRIFDYVFRKINFRQASKAFHEEYLIQGTAIRKNTLVVKRRSVIYMPTQQDQDDFLTAIEAAIEQGLEEPPIHDPVEFEVWRTKANELGLAIPQMPTPGPVDIVKYKGPDFLYTSLFDMAFDPHMDPQAQECIIQQSIVPKKWVEEMTGTEDHHVFDPIAVGEALDAKDEEIREWHDEMATMYGLDVPGNNDPRLKDKVVLWEVWKPLDKKAPYRVIANRQVAINRNFNMPYIHGNHPYIFGRNYPKPGVSIGMPEAQVVERMLYELTTLRGLRLDAILLSILPVFVKSKDTAITDLLREYVPGTFIETARPDEVRALDKPTVDAGAFREITEVMNDIDNALGTLPALRGQQSLPRVPSSAHERALSVSMSRIKDRVIDFESEMDPFIENSLYIMYQFWSREDKSAVGGYPEIDPFADYTREDFLKALEMDLAFRGATTALDEDIEMQRLKEWFTVLSQAAAGGGLPEFKTAEMAKHITDKMTKQKSDKFFRTEQEMQELTQQQQQQEQPPNEGEQEAEAVAPPAEA